MNEGWLLVICHWSSAIGQFSTKAELSKLISAWFAPSYFFHLHPLIIALLQEAGTPLEAFSWWTSEFTLLSSALLDFLPLGWPVWFRLFHSAGVWGSSGPSVSHQRDGVGQVWRAPSLVWIVQKVLQPLKDWVISFVNRFDFNMICSPKHLTTSKWFIFANRSLLVNIAWKIRVQLSIKSKFKF